MASFKTSTGRVGGIDYRVWRAMAITCLLSLGLLGYDRIKHNQKARSCVPAQITVSGNFDEMAAICNLNRIYLYGIEAKGFAGNVEWDFNDGTPKVKGRTVHHRFMKEGIYKVVATVNGKCRFEREVMVRAAVSLMPESRELQIFADSANPVAGSTVNFSASSNLPVSSYEWTLAGSAEVQTGRVASFIFEHPGEYTVWLKVNNERSAKAKTIKVIEKPLTLNDLGNNMGAVNNDIGDPGRLFGPGEDPFSREPVKPPVPVPADTVKNTVPKPKPIEITPEILKGLLQTVLDEKKEITELYPYLEYRETTMVDVNRSKKPVSLSDFCRNNKGRVIKTLNYSTDDRKSIQTLKVELERVGFLRRIFN